MRLKGYGHAIVIPLAVELINACRHLIVGDEVAS